MNISRGIEDKNLGFCLFRGIGIPARFWGNKKLGFVCVLFYGL
jgi:hypothetical protein